MNKELVKEELTKSYDIFQEEYSDIIGIIEKIHEAEIDQDENISYLNNIIDVLVLCLKTGVLFEQFEKNHKYISERIDYDECVDLKEVYFKIYNKIVLCKDTCINFLKTYESSEITKTLKYIYNCLTNFPKEETYNFDKVFIFYKVLIYSINNNLSESELDINKLDNNIKKILNPEELKILFYKEENNESSKT